jgi:tRNA pseudouridine13 synthase
MDGVLGFKPEGYGEHIYLQIRKCDINTDFLARQLAKFVAVSRC